MRISDWSSDVCSSDRQVHPDDDEARARGYPRGKDEAWLVLDADPGAAIALGMRKVMTREALRAAALDGTIEDHLFWQAVKAGDFFYTRAGTTHAIGEGVTLELGRASCRERGCP